MVLTPSSSVAVRAERIGAIASEIDRKLIASQEIIYGNVLVEIMNQYLVSRRTASEFLDVAIMRVDAKREGIFIVDKDRAKRQARLI